ncbi:MAG TPA: T9SS type A sorting domain-containing protein [Bacteroidetes bacterium]|nr:T9SS type A sorting domain-containing protein [Bacteroidota bacterium]
MRNSLIISLLLFLLFSSLQGQTSNWVDISPGPTNYCFDMHWLDDNQGFVVGMDSAKYYCYRSSDGGNSWANSQLPARMTRVFFIDAQNGFATGNGLFTKTNDGGLSWVNSVALPGLPFSPTAVEIQFTDLMTGYATYISGFDSYGFKTTDGGSTWANVAFPIPNGSIQLANLTAARKTFWFLDAMNGFAGQESGWLHYTNDGAVSWDSIQMATDFLPVVIDFVDSATGFATGQGKTYQTTDAGQTWNLRSSPSKFGDANEFVGTHTEFHANSEAITPSTWLSGMIKSTSGGLFFEVVDAPGSGSWVCDDLDFPSPLRGYALTIRSSVQFTQTAIWKTSNGAVGLEQPVSQAIHLEIFPNPARETLGLRVRRTGLHWAAVQDLQGKELLRSYTNGFQPTLALDVSALPVGMYLLRARTRDGQLIAKQFIKAK